MIIKKFCASLYIIIKKISVIHKINFFVNRRILIQFTFALLKEVSPVFYSVPFALEFV